MIWHSRFYAGDKVKERLEEIKSDLEHGKKVKNIYLITLCENGRDQLDLFPARTLHAQHPGGRQKVIVGIAGDKTEAVSLIAKMAEDCTRETGEADIRKMFEDSYSCT